MIGNWRALRAKRKMALALDFPVDWESAQRGSTLGWAWRILASKVTTVKTQIEEKSARTLELPLLVRRLVYSFCYVSTGG